MKNGKFLVLAIESSCDETAAAVVADGRYVLSNIISSQIDIHREYGGVVPEIASRHHVLNINRVIEDAIKEAGVSLEEIDLIGVTYGPGLVGALVIGISAAKAMAFALNKPIIGVNHMHGHVSSNYITYGELKPPFTALVVSGGHTNLVEVKSYCDYEVIGSTRDDAVGEAYDKVARVLGLGYPGGPKIESAAKNSSGEEIGFKRVMLEKDSNDFSFSGLKTAVLNYVNSERQKMREINIADVAFSFQNAVVDVLVAKSVKAAHNTSHRKLVLAGGVACNDFLRKRIKEECDVKGVELYLPDKKLCTDNAAMIGSAAYYSYRDKGEDNLLLDAVPNLDF